MVPRKCSSKFLVKQQPTSSSKDHKHLCIAMYIRRSITFYVTYFVYYFRHAKLFSLHLRRELFIDFETSLQ